MTVISKGGAERVAHKVVLETIATRWPETLGTRKSIRLVSGLDFCAFGRLIFRKFRCHNGVSIMLVSQQAS